MANFHLRGWTGRCPQADLETVNEINGKQLCGETGGSKFKAQS